MEITIKPAEAAKTLIEGLPLKTRKLLSIQIQVLCDHFNIKEDLIQDQRTARQDNGTPLQLVMTERTSGAEYLVTLKEAAQIMGLRPATLRAYLAPIKKGTYYAKDIDDEIYTVTYQ